MSGLLLVNGCANTRGPKLVANSHVDYNKAVTQVVSEEPLLNIVRRRFNEAPQFVTVASISSNINTSGTVGAEGSFADPGGFTGAGINGAVTFTDSPTVTITPLAGEEIAGPLTKRMNYASVAKLTNAGYLASQVMAMMVEDFTNVRGPKLGVGDDFRPGTKKYVELIDLMDSLIKKNQLVVGTFRWSDPYSDITYTADQITPENQISVVALGEGKGRYNSFDGGKTYYFTDKNMYAAMWIPEEARTSGDGKRVIELLNLQPDPLKKIWRFSASKVIEGEDLNWQADNPRSEVKMLMRSFYTLMNFLAYGVRVPPEWEQDGRAFTTKFYEQAVTQGRAFDLNDKFVVHWSNERPDDAFVAVSHRGVWFSISTIAICSRSGSSTPPTTCSISRLCLHRPVKLRS